MSLKITIDGDLRMLRSKLFHCLGAAMLNARPYTDVFYRLIEHREIFRHLLLCLVYHCTLSAAPGGTPEKFGWWCDVTICMVSLTT